MTVRRIGRDKRVASLDDLRFSFGLAAIEAELRNRRTNTRSAVAIMPARAETVTASGLAAVFEKFAKRISTRISEARTELSRRARAPAPLAPPKKK